MEKAVLQRVKDLLQLKGITVNLLSKSISVPQTTLNKQVKGLSAMPLSTVLAILDYLPEVSAEWLLRGEGTMLKSQHTVTYDINNEDECLGRAACPISPKAAALADADRILGKDEETSLGDPRLEQYIAALVRRQFQQELQKMMSRVG